MPGQPSSPAFVFHEKIDAAFIYNMYEDDFPYIEHIFRMVLDHFEEDRSSIITYYKEEQLEQLRRSVHKIKPAFGFVGMPGIQEKCKSFEHKCYLVQYTSELAAEYRELVEELDDAMLIIANEYKKLVHHNMITA